MQLTLTVDTANVNDLKSARMTIDRLIADAEANAESVRSLLNFKVAATPSLIHYAPHGPDMRGKYECGAKEDGDNWTKLPGQVTCKACKRLSPGLWPEYAVKPCPECGQTKCNEPSHDLAVNPPNVYAKPRTRAEVLKSRSNGPVGGCCNRYADNMSCNCLESAIDERIPIKVSINGKCECLMTSKCPLGKQGTDSCTSSELILSGFNVVCSCAPSV